MFELPHDFQWLPPWSALDHEPSALAWGELIAELEFGEQVADCLVAELRREMPNGHVLKHCELAAVGRCDADPNEFLFATDSPQAPLVVVHLTWSVETDPMWPFTYTFSTLQDWIEQMNKEHHGHTNRNADGVKPHSAQ